MPLPLLDFGTNPKFDPMCILSKLHHAKFNPSCPKLFGTHIFYEGGGGGGRVEQTPPMISKTVDSANFNSGRPLELSMRDRKLV